MLLYYLFRSLKYLCVMSCFQLPHLSDSQVMRDYFPAILSLAEVLLRSPEPAITFFAASMYKNGFVAFDTYCQQVTD